MPDRTERRGVCDHRPWETGSENYTYEEIIENALRALRGSVLDP